MCRFGFLFKVFIANICFCSKHASRIKNNNKLLYVAVIMPASKLRSGVSE